MKHWIVLLGAMALQAQQVSLSDTLTNAVGGGSFTGRITVTLNAPGNASPLYYSTTSLTGWQAVYCLGVTGSDCTTATAAGVFAATLYANSTITPAGTSYSARFTPAKGSPWSEVWVITPSTTTLRQVRATTVPTPTTTFQTSQIVPGSNGQVLTTTAGASAWGSVPACATCVVTSGSYADPAWITSLAGSKVSGAVASATLAASATALATPRTIAGVSFNGTANISIASTNLSDTANIVRNNAANTYTAGSKQTFAHSATTAGLNVGVQAAAPSSPAQGDVFFNTTLTRKGVYDGTQWRYELYAPSSGTGVVSWDGTSLSASTTLAGLSSVTSTSFVGALTGNASTATALASTVASGRLWIGQGTGVPGSDSVICADTTNHRLGVGTCSPAALFQAYVSATRYFAFNNNIATIRSDNNTSPPTINLENQAGSGMGAIDFYTYSGQTTPTLRWQGLDETNFTGSHYFYTATGGSANQPLVERLRVGSTVLVSNATLETTAASTSAPVWSMVVRNSNNGGTTGYGAGLKLKNSSESGVEANKWAGIAAIATATFSNDTAMAFYSASGTASAPTEKMRLLGNGNLLLGTTTDLGYGLHAANKGTNGNLLVFDPTATTGTTKAVFKEGAGQSTTASTEWQDSAGTFTARVQAGGGFQSKVAYSVIDSGATVNHIGLYTTGLSIASGKLIAFSATTEATATKDLSLSRASAGVLQVGDGGANALGTVTASTVTTSSVLAVGSNNATTESIYVIARPGGNSGANSEAGFSMRIGGGEKARLFTYGTTTTQNLYLDLPDQGFTIRTYSGFASLASLTTTGSFTLFNQTATTGNTKEVIRAGAGQSTNLTEWQNNAGSVVARIDSNGSVLAPSGSASVPGLSFTAATNAGIYWDGTYLNFAVGGSRVGYIRSADIGLPAIAVFGNTQVSGATDGNLLLRNNAGTAFSLLQFGGTTSSFPALKRSSAILQARLADDSAYTDIGVNAVIVNKAAPSASSDACTAGQLWAGDMGGTKYAFYCVASGTIVRSAFASF